LYALKALVISNSNIFAIAFKSEKERQVGRAISQERESHQQRSKELIPKRMQRVINLQGAIKKIPILLSQN
jgi:hypothetical protein